MDQSEIKTPDSCPKGHSILVFVRYSAFNVKGPLEIKSSKRKVPKPKDSYIPIPFLVLLCWCSTFLLLLQQITMNLAS